MEIEDASDLIFREALRRLGPGRKLDSEALQRKMAEVLKEQGETIFAQLSESAREQLREEGLKMHQQPASDIVRWEIDYRRQKQWNIFSWCSALLVAIIGGTIALRTGFFAKPPMGWNVYLQSVVSFAVVVLVVYTCLWIDHSDDRENTAIDQLDGTTKKLLKKEKHWGWTYSSRVVGVLLGLAAILATWIPIQFPVE